MHDDHLTGKATLNAGATLLEYGVRAAVGLVVTPIVLGALGQSLFGVWEMLRRLATYLAAADGRPAEALRLVVANRLGTGTAAALRRSVGSAVYAWLLFLPLSGAVGVAIIWLAPSITGVPAELTVVVRLTSALLVVNFILATAAAIPQAAVQGANLGYAAIGWLACLHLLGGALVAGAVIFGTGIAGVAAAQIVASIVALVVFLALARRLLPRFGIRRPRPEELRPFLRLSTWTVAGDLIARLALASDVLILGALATSSAVASYVLTGYAATALVAILSVVLYAAAPGLGALIGDGQYDRARAVRDELMVLTWMAVTVAGATTLMWNRSFVTLWVGPEHYAGTTADLLIVVLMSQTVFIRADAYVINATLEIRDRVLAAALAAAVSLALAALLTPALHITGLCLGLAAGRLLQSAWHPVLVRRLLGGARRTAPLDVARRLVVTTIVFATFLQLGSRVDAQTWIEWLAGASGSVVLTLALAWGAGLGADGRRIIRRRVGIILSYGAGPLPLRRLPS
jgi:O-antigen/teichoic acid export membrane protein